MAGETIKRSLEFGISIDFFGTLVEIDRDVPMIHQVLTDRGYPCSLDVERIWNSTGFDGQCTHDPTREEYLSWRLSALSNLAELCGAPKAVAGALASELVSRDQEWTVRCIEGTKNLLSVCRRLTPAVCILTNWDYSMSPYLQMAGLPTDTVVLTSAQVGARKPSRKIFSACQELLKVSPAYHIHVGDSWNCDVSGAIRSGAWAVWVTDTTPIVLPNRIRRCGHADIDITLRQLIADAEAM